MARARLPQVLILYDRKALRKLPRDRPWSSSLGQDRRRSQSPSRTAVQKHAAPCLEARLHPSSASSLHPTWAKARHASQCAVAAACSVARSLLSQGHALLRAAFGLQRYLQRHLLVRRTPPPPREVAPFTRPCPPSRRRYLSAENGIVEDGSVSGTIPTQIGALISLEHM